ncbi:MAG TPA: hypothetical protein VES67_07530 [Vicinamibacterales bacterium]|nr:hypothetical protein [Vicinamibacterales bacterium]
MHSRYFLAVMAGLAALACQGPVQPGRIDIDAAGSAQSLAANGPGPKASGGGQLLVSNMFEGTFAFNAVETGNGGAVGQLHYSLLFQGLPVEFYGRVTCFAVDSINHRAWIGGVITGNLSEHPSYTTPRTQVGRDIWFRVVDYGEGAGAPADRSTFVGFEGDRGIITSAEYCAVKLWVDGDVGTQPVIHGNIQVKP